MALYTVAAETGCPAGEVRREQVAPLVWEGQYGGNARKLAARWEERLEAAGHQLDAEDDPVAARWRVLRHDHTPPEDAPDWVWDDSTRRMGLAAVEGLRAVLAPRWRDELALV
ncbi:hypothetical protein ACTWQF_34435 [Streptomyces sp. 8N114]|uniref:hypothetical protein n=1 Tax=Streptomyces sp. 8N114 TaxID=3457419 RepID=UPI003FD24D9F